MDAEKQAQNRDEIEEHARQVMSIAGQIERSPTPDPQLESDLDIAAKIMATALLIAILALIMKARTDGQGDQDQGDLGDVRRLGDDSLQTPPTLLTPTGSTETPTGDQVATRATQIASDATAWTEAHSVTLERRRDASDTTEPLSPPGTEDPWERQAARTLATRSQAETVIQLGTEVPGEFDKVWISRGDTNVRSLHRKLHGNHVELSGDFWRWPASGRSLAYPGDPAAPLSEILNCRCVLILVLTSQRLAIPSAFQPADIDKSFAVAASVPANPRVSDGRRVPDGMCSDSLYLHSTTPAT